MKIVVMGTGPFAVPMFQALVGSSDYEVPCLITRPSRQGKSRQTVVNPMRDAAESHGLPVHAPEDINNEEGVELLGGLEPDLLVVCDYGQILSNEVLRLAKLGGINLHGSLLPRYRGAAPVQWALLNGDPETGVTVIHMTPRMDAGPVLALRSVPIDSDETHEELEPRLAQLGVEPVMESIAKLAAWDGESSIGEPQDTSKASKAPRLKKSHGLIDWSQPTVKIHNQVRGLKPWPGAFTFVPRKKASQRLLIDRLRVVTADELTASNVAWDAIGPGEVVVSDRDRLWIRTGDGVAAIETLQPAGKRMMGVDEYLRGFQPAPGLKMANS